MPTTSKKKKKNPVLPATMVAAAIDRFGGPEVLTMHTLPVPVPDKHEVLIALDTSGVGVWDAQMRAGWWPDGQPHFPLVLGTDGAGTVAALGSQVRRFDLEQEVYSYSFANPRGGFYAEYVAVHQDRVAPIPKDLDLERAGAIPTTGLTALQGIDDVLRVQKGESILIHGASGGVGTLAVQFAKRRRARVLATATSADGMLLVRQLGADVVLDGRSKDLADLIHQEAPDGLDALLGLTGGKALENCLKALKPDGRLAYPNGVEPEPGEKNRIQVTAYDARAGVPEFERLNRAVEEASLKVPIASSYRLIDAMLAHRRLAEGHVLGKIVLRTHQRSPEKD
jgi:NADPH2:quinone reductase